MLRFHEFGTGPPWRSKVFSHGQLQKVFPPSANIEIHQDSRVIPVDMAPTGPGWGIPPVISALSVTPLPRPAAAARSARNSGASSQRLRETVLRTWDILAARDEGTSI